MPGCLTAQQRAINAPCRALRLMPWGQGCGSMRPCISQLRLLTHDMLLEAKRAMHGSASHNVFKSSLHHPCTVGA